MASDANGYDLGEIMARIAAMQSESIILKGDGQTQYPIPAVPYWPYQAESCPYFFNKIVSMEPENISNDTAVDRYTIEMGLVCGHLTAGYKGDLSMEVLSEWIPAVLQYFDKQRWLNTKAGIYTKPARWVFHGDNGAEITGIPQGQRTINNAGVEATQHYIGFMLAVPLVRNRY